MNYTLFIYDYTLTSASSSSSSFPGQLASDPSIDLKQLDSRVIITKISICLTIIICLVGIIGNLLSLKVFSSTKLPSTSSRTYLIALTLSDSLFLLVHFLDNTCREMVEHFQIDFPFNITDQKETICRTFALLRSTCRCASPWIIVVFTLERFLVVHYPNHTNTISKPHLARRFIYIVLVLSVIVSLYSPILSGIILDPTKKLINTTSPYSIFVNLFEKKTKKSLELEHMFFKRTCDILSDYRSLYLYLTLFYTIIVILLPLIIISVFNALLILRLYKSADQWTSAKLKLHEQEMSYKELRDKKVQIENAKITWMLIIISVTFIVLTLPHAIIYFTINISQIKRRFLSRITTHVLLLIMKFTELLFLLNHSVNFFLYILTRNSFRRVFKEKFSCGCFSDLRKLYNQENFSGVNKAVLVNQVNKNGNNRINATIVKTKSITNISNVKWLNSDIIYTGNLTNNTSTIITTKSTTVNNCDFNFTNQANIFECKTPTIMKTNDVVFAKGKEVIIPKSKHVLF